MYFAIALVYPSVIKMSILKYLKQKDGLPDPRGQLSTTVSSGGIARANKEVALELAAATQAGKKRGPYRR